MVAFVAIVTKKPNTTITLKELRGAFNVIDTYDDCHDGTILMDSLLKAFTVYSNQALSTEDALELIRQVAPQSDNGLFDYAQFLNIYFEPERVGDDGV
ncbi:hypothetical protein HDV02_005809 [Globomyces sp. JEL0801]|nr:hypothetical protein HDV02_005809 [Globomyces sp. JEL0801]